MTRARRLWLTLHRWLGLGLGAWFVLLGLTGSLLVFYPAMEPWFDARIAPRAAQGPVSIERVAQALSQAHPQRTEGWRIELPAPGQALVTARYLNPAETAGHHFAPLLVTVDGRTGEVLANRFWGDTVMTWLYDLHYTLLLGEAGHRMVAVAGLLLMTSVLSGLWLWWPRAGHWRSALHFKRRASAPRRVYDLHKWSGLVAAPLLLVLGLTGAVLGWPAMADPVIALFSAPTASSVPVSRSDARLPRLPVDTVLQQLQARWPTAQVRWIDVPGTSSAAPYRARVRHPGDPGDRFPSSIVWLDARTAEVLAVRQPGHFSGGDVFKQWMHPLHSGEAFGLAGRLAICASGGLPLALAVTGWLRWRDKRRAARRRWLVAALIALACGAACQAQAHDVADDAAAVLDPVKITGHYDNAVGTSDAASQGAIRAELLKSRPALRPGEVLEFVPGMIVTQHSGDGKANQYFLRGFNLDHGTDFATSVDGMPVNMPTHGHGQGYTDLNFLIPELVDRIDYRKGPYFATHGDFASAGAADIRYRRQLDAPFAQITLGERGYRRAVGGASFKLNEDTTWLGAVEWMRNDGPWTVPEGLLRQNAVMTMTHGTGARGGSLSFMTYAARWSSTDQVPERLVDSGQIGRFDAMDPSDGGSTGRTSVSGEWHDRDGDGATEVSAYALRYRLKLFSNFTYAMDRPATGDQFSQQDDRNVYGLKAARAWQHPLGGFDARTEFGVQARRDVIDVGLYDTQARSILSTTRRDDVQETMLSAYAQNQLTWSPWLRSVLGVRADQARFGVDSLGHAANAGSTRDSQVSPKLSLIAGPWSRTELFFNAGRGLHSNDARGTTTTVDPRSGDPVDRVPALVASRGWEIGARTEALPGLQSSLAFWHLKFDSELVYVGDAGATEASGASTRRGVEWNNRWTPTHHFLLDADLAWTHARFDNGDRIPNAVDAVASVAATLRNMGPWSASLQWRYLGSGALIEDNSVRSRVSSTFNLRVTRSLQAWLGRGSAVTVDVFNLFDRKVDDIEYYYASRLPAEGAPVVDRHVHPAEPRTVRLTFLTPF